MDYHGDEAIDEVALGKDLERVRVWFKNKDELSPPKGLIDRRKNYAMKLSKAAGHLLQLMGDDRLEDIRDAIVVAFPIIPGEDHFVGSYDGEPHPIPPDLLREVPPWFSLKAGLHYLVQIADAEAERQRELRERKIVPWLDKDWLIGTRLARIFEKHFKSKAGYTRDQYEDNSRAKGKFIDFIKAVLIEFGLGSMNADVIAKAVAAGRKSQKLRGAEGPGPHSKG